MINWLNMIALLVLGAMIGAVVWFRWKAGRRPRASSRVPDIVIAVLSVGAWVVSFQWHLDTATRVVGFPFTAAMYELHDGRWVDYVGAITLPAMAANLVFWVLLFRLPLLWLRYTRKEPQQARAR